MTVAVHDDGRMMRAWRQLVGRWGPEVTPDGGQNITFL